MPTFVRKCVFNNVLTYVLRWCQACLLYFYENKRNLSIFEMLKEKWSPQLEENDQI